MLIHPLESGPRAEFVHITDREESADDSMFAASYREFAGQRAYKAHVARLVAYFELAAQSGLEALSSEQCHEVSKKDKIYELRAGRLRLLFFKARSGKLVVCSHIFLKATQATPPAEVKQATRLRTKFEKAEDQGLTVRVKND